MGQRSLDAVVEQIRKVAFRDDGVVPSDGELLECYLARGEDMAFECLVRRHAAMVLGVCRRVLDNQHDAEDAFQATFLVLARKGRSIVQRPQVGNWLYGVAYRTALRARQFRAQQRAREMPMRDEAEAVVAPREDANELLPLLDEALNHLPEKYRIAVVLCELEGRSRKSAADQLGIPEGTLSSRLAKAHQMLGRRLARHAPTASLAVVSALLAQTASAAAVSSSLLAAAVNIQNAPTAKVLALAESVLQTMLLIKIKKVALGLVVAPLLAWAGASLVMSALGNGQPDGVEDGQQIAARRKLPKPPEEEAVPQPEVKKELSDQERMQGVWRIVSAKFDGNAMTAAQLNDLSLTVKGESMLWDVMDGPAAPAKFTLTPLKTPKQIVIKGESAAGIGTSGVASGVYKLEGEKLWFCLADSVKLQPGGFVSKEGSDSLLCVLERDKKALPDQVVVAKGPNEPVKISAIMPGNSPTLARVNSGKFRVQFRLENTSKKKLVLWPYLTLKVLDEKGKPVPLSRNLGRYGLRNDDKSILEGVPFVTLEPGATHTIDVSLNNYFWNSLAIQSWELKSPGTYTLEMHYRYNRADAKKDFGAGCQDIDNPKHNWNRAFEIERAVQCKVRVVDAVPGNGADGGPEPKVDDGPPPQASEPAQDQKNDGPKPISDSRPGSAKPLEGTWKQSDTEKLNLVRFEPSRMVQFRDGELRFVRVAYKDGRIIRHGIGGSSESLGIFVVDKNELLFEDSAGKKHKFARLAKDPPELILAPVSVAEAKAVDRKKVQEVQRELARREELAGKLRREFRAVLKDNVKRADKIKEMVKADADDTRYLVGLVKEIGWIDSNRFGHAAQDSAVIILMHTADPALKAAALPILKKEVLAGRFDAESFAGLYDRYCFQVGLPDRYGMHVSPDAKGQLVVGPLEDRSRVDEFRKEIGLPALAKYLERRRGENGGKDVRILD